MRNIYTPIGNDEKCWLDIYTVGLAVTGRVREIGHNVLQFPWQTVSSSSSPSYFHIFFLTAFLEEAFITIIRINNNPTINNNCGRLRSLSLLFKIPIGARKNLF
jgi:hypothetical protein